MLLFYRVLCYMNTTDLNLCPGHHTAVLLRLFTHALSSQIVPFFQTLRTSHTGRRSRASACGPSPLGVMSVPSRWLFPCAYTQHYKYTVLASICKARRTWTRLLAWEAGGREIILAHLPPPSVPCIGTTSMAMHRRYLLTFC